MVFYHLDRLRDSHAWIIAKVRNVPQGIHQVIACTQYYHRPSQWRLFSNTHESRAERLQSKEIVKVYIAERIFESSKIFMPVLRGLVIEFATQRDLGLYGIECSV